MKLKSKIVLIALLVFTIGKKTYSQKAHVCHYYGENAEYTKNDICNYLSFTSNKEAEESIDNILKQVGLKRNFIVMECPNINNALAVNLPSDLGLIRYIIYDNEFFERVNQTTSTDWSAISILAHEVGHHLNGHTLDNKGSQHNKELEADEFSGFVLFKLGATLEQAQAAINEYNSIEDSSTHPGRKKRLEAIKKGYNDAKVVSNNTVSSSTISTSDIQMKSTRTKSRNLIDYKGEIEGELDYIEKQFKRNALGNGRIRNLNAASELFELLEDINEDLSYSDKRTFIRYLTEIENHLNNYGVIAYQEKDYSSAFLSFYSAIKASILLSNMNASSRLDDKSLFDDMLFFAAVSGYYGDYKSKVGPILEELYHQRSTEPFVYEALFNIYKETDMTKALMYLQRGREIVPNDTGLLFAEINYYLAEGKTEILIDKLKYALKKEPRNASIYNTLGSVYDQLSQAERRIYNDKKSEEYFDLALYNYEKTLKLDRNNYDATYSIGALHYNKAAAYVDKLNILASDLSPSGMRKYDKLKEEMDDCFKDSLPYFEKCKKLRSNDQNVDVALREIRARLR